MMSSSRICGILGLANSANQVVLGDKLLLAIKQRKVKIVIIASDIGATNGKKIFNKCRYYQIEYRQILTKDILSKALGKNNISSLGIKDQGLADLVLKNIGGVLNGEK